MKKSGLVGLIGIALGAMFLLAVGLSTQAANNPNIVFILTDDVGWGDISTYNPSSLVELPAIDGLANEGIRFTDAHTSASKCAPSRYSIVTGNYQWRGLRSWGQWNYKGGSQLLSGQLSLGDVLQQANYSSAFIGKHHLGAEFFRKNSNAFASGNDAEDIVDFSRPMVDGPQDHGFNYSFTALRGIQASPYAFFENRLLDGAASDLITWGTGDYGDTEIEKAGIGLPSWVTRDVGPTLLSKAIEFIDTHIATQVSQGTDNPFFLYFNTEAVHSPRKPPISLGGRSVLGASGVNDRMDMLIEIDVIVEQILLALEERNLINETIIIFTSDNGAQRLGQEVNAGHLANGALRGDKGTIYEGGHRVPLIIKWGPSVFESSSLTPGTEITTLVGIQDVFATLADMVDVPLAADQGRDSFSFLPALMGQTTGTIRDHMVHQADEPEDGASDGIIGKHFAYRHNNWKLIFNNNQNPVGLYDLDSDLFESTNLINESQHASLVDQLHAQFLDTLNSERTAPISGNATPVVSVISPSSGSTFETGEVIAFSGSANDNEDGDLSSGLAWSSSLDGALGVGASINVSLSAGPHVITASVVDSGGATGIATVDSVTISSAPTPAVDLTGTVKATEGTDICAMVLASGKFMFSCNPVGVFSLTDLPRENNGTVKRQIYADGFFPKVEVRADSADESVVMTRSGTCPNYNTPSSPAYRPDSAGKRINISGKILLQNSQTPICAMALANGQYMFTCDGTGNYALNIPLDTNGQFKLQVYADGFAPITQKFDEFSANNDVRMARAVECQ